MTPGLEITAQLRVVENLPVVDYPEVAGFVADGLLAATQVDDAEPGAPQADVIIEIEAKFVRSAMADLPQHAAQQRFLGWRRCHQVQDSRNAAHGRDE